VSATPLILPHLIDFMSYLSTNQTVATFIFDKMRADIILKKIKNRITFENKNQFYKHGLLVGWEWSSRRRTGT
jgi:hypothetical protein